MPRMIHLYEYDKVLRGKRLSHAVAVIAERASGSRRWYAATENQLLEEEAARELFPNIHGRYDTFAPTFALKLADREAHSNRRQSTDGREQTNASAGPNSQRAVPRPLV